MFLFIACSNNHKQQEQLLKSQQKKHYEDSIKNAEFEKLMKKAEADSIKASQEKQKK